MIFVEEFIFEQQLSCLFLYLPENNTKYYINIVLKIEKRFLSDYDVYHILLIMLRLMRLKSLDLGNN